MDSTFS